MAIKVADLKKKLEKNEVDKTFPMFFQQNIKHPAEFLLKDEKNASLVQKLRKYQSAIQFISEWMMGSLNPKDEDLQKKIDELDGLQDFLAETEKGESQTNLERIIGTKRVAPTFQSQLEQFGKVFEIQIDLDKLGLKKAPAKEAAVQGGQKAASKSAAGEKVKAEKQDGLPDLDLDEDGEVTASRYIRNLKDHGFPQKNPTRLTDEEKETYLDRFALIMAARELAHSDRGSKAKLVSTYLTPEAIRERADEFKEDPHFSRFFEAIEGDPKKMKAAISSATTGHGGGLDDMFRSYLKNLDPGSLQNYALLDRYMPTAKERIETLQDKIKLWREAVKKQAKLEAQSEEALINGNEDKSKELQDKADRLGDYIQDNSPALASLEIKAIRDLIHAKRDNKKGLDVKIPTSEEDVLNDRVNSLSNDENYMHIFDTDEKLVDDLVHGHGGAMLESLAKKLTGDQYDYGTKEAFGSLTIGERLQKMKEEAEFLHQDLQEELDNMPEGVKTTENYEKLMKKGKECLAEYMLLDGLTRDSDHNIVPEKLNEPYPKYRVEVIHNLGPEDNVRFAELMEDIHEIGLIHTLADMAEKDQNDVMTELAERQKQGHQTTLLDNDRETVYNLYNNDGPEDDLDDVLV